MGNRVQTSRALLLLGAAFLLAGTTAACGLGGSTSNLSPRPAVSVSALPGFSEADREQDLSAYLAVQARAIEVFIRDGTSASDKLAMAREIAAMPEVEAYHFVSKSEALAQFKDRFGERIVANLPMNPLPASFEILVRDQADTAKVAQRFYDDPIVDNDPGTHNGVKAGNGSSIPAPSPSQ